MSIFRSTFSNFVKEQLGHRQNAIQGRSPQAIQQLNSRNAWVRMTSAVDVGGDNGALARSYILQSGTLTPDQNKNSYPTGNLKSGVGNDFDNNAYSNTSYDGNPYTRGIRPMPGITSVEIKNKTAYGSLRDAVVNFQCWDIKQLEDLELLYMRPGYTVLLEWGWAPYLANDGKKDSKGNAIGDGQYTSNAVIPYDIINNISNIQNNQPKIYKALYDKSINSGGNYDAMYGKVQNYSWSARPDGGYDCQTTIISIGEVIDSLKVNYVAPQSFTNSQQGLLVDEFKGTDDGRLWLSFYQKNILAGMWAELWHKLFSTSISNNTLLIRSDSIIKQENTAIVKIPIISNNDDKVINELTNHAQNQVYITLGTVIDLLNEYIIPYNTNAPAGVVNINGKSYASQAAVPSMGFLHQSNQNLNEINKLFSKNKNNNLIYLSLDTNDYEDTDIITTYTGSLLCNASFIQTSVDPTVCLIKNPLWANKTSNIPTAASSNFSSNASKIINIANEAAQKIVDATNVFTNSRSDVREAIELIVNSPDPINTLALVNDNIPKLSKKYSGLEAIFQTGIIVDKYPTIDFIDNVQKPLKAISIVNITFESILSGGKIPYYEVKSSTIKFIGIPPPPPNIVAQQTIQQDLPQALANLKTINDALKTDYFYNKNPGNEIGTVKNIYVNVAYLYQQAVSTTLEKQDPKEKDEINLYNYLKTLIRDIQASIGNLNQFEIHVDPIDNKARIIDVSFVDPTKNGNNSISKNTIYNNLFQLEVHNLKSIVRNYSLESKMFPDQGNVIAIGAQVKAGVQGVQANTMIDFNRQITDRILTQIDYGNKNNDLSINDKGNPSITSLAPIVDLFANLDPNTTPKTDNNTKVTIDNFLSKAKNGLRDMIVYYQTITHSSSANRNLIPTKFSLDMDGIGGIVIGHMFKLSPDILPRGYKAGTILVNNKIIPIGVQLGQAITNVGHTISNGDWVTKIETLNIVLSDDNNEIDLSTLNFDNLNKIIALGASGSSPVTTAIPTNTETTTKHGHTGIVVSDKKDGHYTIISNSSKGFGGSNPGTIESNYTIKKWENVAARNPSQTTAFQYIGKYNSNQISNQYFNGKPYGNLDTAAKKSIGFSTANIQGTENGNVGCAAAVSVMFLTATGYPINKNNTNPIDLGTTDLYNRLLNDPTNWKKREDWRQAQPGDVIITAST